ncbi:hypothetical protein ACVWWG_007191 [Bradyrhizobium sp. LB7.2]
MAASEAQLQYSTNSEARWSAPGMAGFTNEQLERALDPDGWRPRVIPRDDGEEFAPAVKAMLAALDDDSEITATAPIVEPPPDRESRHEEITFTGAETVKPIPAVLARFWALKAADARRKEDARLAAKQATTREQARLRKQRQRAKKRATTAIEVDESDYTEILLADLDATTPLAGISRNRVGSPIR